MYESPINIISQWVDEQIKEQKNQEETAIMAEITRKIGVDVDKQELIRALNYDRQQYNLGYADGKRAGVLEELEEIKSILKENQDEFDVSQGEYELGNHIAYKMAIKLIDKHIDKLKGDSDARQTL